MNEAPLRSVFFSSYSGLGGGETSLRDLLGALDPDRHRPVLVTPGEGRLPEAVRRIGYETQIVPYRGSSTWFLPSLWARLPASRRIGVFLRIASPSVVHSDYHSLPFVLPACDRLGIPVVFTCWAWWFRPRFWQRRFFRDGPRVILAASQAVRTGFLGNPPFIEPEDVPVVYPGVDTGRFHPAPRERLALRKRQGLPADSRLVTLLARFQSVKGHDLFLDAVGRVAPRLPDVRFLVAGENVFGSSADEALKRRILHRVEADPVLHRCVTFLGWVPDPEKLLAASDVLVCSSRFETLGIALLEAMACGLPVVSTNVGGPREIVIEGETGFLVPPGKAEALAERILRLLEDENLRRQMGAAGRERVETRFSLGRYAAEFSQWLESAARTSTADRPSAP
jgi:glycosyltransferase involved in cell wall biosynthesis